MNDTLSKIKSNRKSNKCSARKKKGRMVSKVMNCGRNREGDLKEISSVSRKEGKKERKKEGRVEGREEGRKEK